MLTGATPCVRVGDEEMSCANPEPEAALEPRKEIVKNACMRVLECANAGNVPLWTVYCLQKKQLCELRPSFTSERTFG